LRGIWWGGYISSRRDGFPTSLWTALLADKVNADLFFQCEPGGTLSAFGGDLAPAPYVQKMVPHLRALKRGVAQVLIRMPLRNEDFAFYHSHPSAAAARLIDTFRPPSATLAPLIRFCYRTGRNVRMVTPRTLEKLADVKVLFLSGTTVLSDAEVSALKSFAAKGGVLVSDVETGMMDEFFVSRAASPLSGLVKPMPDLSDDNAVESFLAAAGVSGVRERVSGLPQDQKMVRVREADGCRIVGFTTPTSSIGRKVTVDFGRKGYVYEVDRGFIGETDKVVTADALLDAAQLLGDRKSELTAYAMSSATETHLQKLEGSDLFKPSELPGNLKVYNGRLVIVDDNIADGTVYLFAPGAVAYNQCPYKASAPQFEPFREELKSQGGIVTRDRSIIHVRGIKWATTDTNPTNATLATAEKWARVYETKAIRVCKLVGTLG
jgi:hypothetical protein